MSTDTRGCSPVPAEIRVFIILPYNVLKIVLRNEAFVCGITLAGVKFRHYRGVDLIAYRLIIVFQRCERELAVNVSQAC